MNKQNIHPIRKLRTRHKLNQAELGNLLDLNGNFIAQVENGFSEMPRRALLEMCDYFKQDPLKLDQAIANYRKKRKAELLAKVTQTEYDDTPAEHISD